MSELSIALVATAFGFGFRHGIDWDHIAAIGDISTTSPDRRTALRLSTIYAVAHGLVVMALGVALVLAGFTIGDQADRLLGHAVGVTLVLLGVWVLHDMLRRGDNFRLRSRAMLVRDGLARRGGQARKAAGDRVLVSDPPDGGYDVATASGVGVIHGIGIETPTQIALFVAATQAVSRQSALALLVVWVVGLLAANTAVAIVAANGIRRLAPVRRFHVGVGLVVGLSSVVLGVMMTVGAEQALPSLV